MRKFLNGVSRDSVALTARRFSSGIPSSPSMGGAMKARRSWKRSRKRMDWPIAPMSRPGSTFMTWMKAGRPARTIVFSCVPAFQTNRGRPLRFRTVLNYLAFLHHEGNTFSRSDVGGGVAGHRDDVGEFALF